MQLSLNFLIKESFSEENFVISKCNEEFFYHVNNPKFTQNNPIFLITGPRFSGKTHLSYIWKNKFNGNFIFRNNYIIENYGSYIIDNIEQYSDNQSELFGIIEEIVAKNAKLMITSTKTLNETIFDFKDLSSRLKNIFTITIQNPDRDLVKPLIIRYLSKYQINMDDKIVNHIAISLTKDYFTIRNFCDKLHEMYHFKKYTLKNINQIIANIQANLI